MLTTFEIKDCFRDNWIALKLNTFKNGLLYYTYQGSLIKFKELDAVSGQNREIRIDDNEFSPWKYE